MNKRQRVITAGRAYVRLVEAANTLLGYRPAWTEALLLRLVAALPPEVSAEMLAASETVEGPVQEFGEN